MNKFIIILLVAVSFLYSQNRKIYVDSIFVKMLNPSTDTYQYGNITNFLKTVVTVKDTSNLKKMNYPDGSVVYLRGLNSGSTIGAGYFVLADSAYPEGGIAFDAPETGKQWVRVSFLRDHIVYPQWFGAKGNGTTDDTQAIKNALYAAYLANADYVFFHEGTYEVTETINMYNVSMVGSGNSSVIDFSSALGDDNLFEYNGLGLSGIEIRNLKFIGQEDDYSLTTTSGNCFYLRPTTASNITIENITIENFRNGINLYPASDSAVGISVINNVINGCSYFGIRLLHVVGAIVSGNHFDLSRDGIGDGIDGGLAIWIFYGSSNLITDNHIQHNSQSGLEAINVHSKYSIISHNTLYDVHTAIVMEPTQETNPNHEDGSNYAIISNNTINNAYSAIILRNDPANNNMGVHNCLISKNLIRDATVGIMLANETLPDSAKCYNNTISENKLIKAPIRVWGSRNTYLSNNSLFDTSFVDIASSDSTYINGGTILRSSYGIRIRNNSNNIYVNGVNFIDISYRAIDFVSGSKLSVKNSSFLNSRSIADARGINIGSSSLGVNFSNNTFKGFSRYLEISGLADSCVSDIEVGKAQIFSGANSPEGSVNAYPGSIYLRTDGNQDSTIYYKEYGNFNTNNWVVFPRLFTTSIQYDPPELAADSSVTSNSYYYSGLKIGDMILVAPTETTIAQDFKFSIYAYICATDSFRLVFTNGSGITKNLANGSYKILIIRR